VQTHGILTYSTHVIVFIAHELQETLQELALAKEKSVSAWDEASKSMFLLDEQSQKIEELSDQMKDLKSFYSVCNQTTAVTVPLNAANSAGVGGLDSIEAHSSANVMTNGYFLLFIILYFESVFWASPACRFFYNPNYKPK
jgi:hypothetical protein